MSAAKTRLTFTEGTSSKFWEVEIRGAELHIAWGKLGTAGQRQVKALASPEAHEETFSFDGGVARVRHPGGALGLLDTTGALRIPAVHRTMRPQAHGRVTGELQAGGWMLYDTAIGGAALEATWDDIVPLGAEPIYGVRRGKKWGVIDRDGRVLVPLEHDLVRALVWASSP